MPQPSTSNANPSTVSPANSSSFHLKPRHVPALACLAAAAGVFALHSSVAMLMAIWRDDDLKSMGLVVPFVCAGLILRVWKRMGWASEGSWWGFAIFAGAAVLQFLRDQTLLIILIHGTWSLQLPPLPLVAVVYAASMVVLFGGWRLLRAAWFPVLLMWAVIPVPSTFSGWVDLPLQHASAHVARAFAHGLGQQLTDDKLRLMFTPEFGMFIAPGCNGIRGAITLGLAAVVVGYLYRFRWFVFAPVVAGAVLLGYLFNFLRLCLLVVYYKIALPYRWLQTHAKQADYVIGGCLFVCALCLFFAVANRFRRDPEDVLPEEPRERVRGRLSRRSANSLLLRTAAVLAVALLFGSDAARQMRAERLNAAQPIPELPATIGGWQRVRTWVDSTGFGVPVYTWAEYAPPAGQPGPHVSLGISPVMSVHDANVCHVARDEEDAWHAPLAFATPSGSAKLSAALFNNGRVQRLEASTVCENGVCSQVSAGNKHITLITARPVGRLPMEETLRPVPVMLKVETTDTVSPWPTVEPQLAAQLGRFLAGADLAALARPYAHRR